MTHPDPKTLLALHSDPAGELAAALVEIVRQRSSYSSVEELANLYGEFQTTIDAVLQSEAAGTGEVDVPESWPVAAGPGGINPWFVDAASFIALVKDHPSVWLSYNAAKYLNIRIDTRDCGFVLTSRDGGEINMGRLLKAMREDRFRGAYREAHARSRTPTLQAASPPNAAIAPSASAADPLSMQPVGSRTAAGVTRGQLYEAVKVGLLNWSFVKDNPEYGGSQIDCITDAVAALLEPKP